MKPGTKVRVSICITAFAVTRRPEQALTTMLQAVQPLGIDQSIAQLLTQPTGQMWHSIVSGKHAWYVASGLLPVVLWSATVEEAMRIQLELGLKGLTRVEGAMHLPRDSLIRCQQLTAHTPGSMQPTAGWRF